MKSLLLLLFLAAGCSTPNTPPMPVTTYFSNLRGCFLLFDLVQNKLVKQDGESCYEPYPAASTFQVPLSVISLDTGALKNEEHIFKWDGKRNFIESWNKDQNARTWMLFSVVWFSQSLTSLIGEEKLQHYLNAFDYGNKDFNAGIRDVRLLVSSSAGPVFKITPREQLEFLKKLWTLKLPASERAQKITREVMYLETSPEGYRISGKTGSNTYQEEESRQQFGWFIGHVGRGDKSYLFVTQLSDLYHYDGNSFGGFRARELTRKILQDQSLW